MNNLQKSLAAVLLSATTIAATAQTGGSRSSFNQLKVNLPGIAARNYQVQYERMVSRRFSVALAYRTMPDGAVPFESNLLQMADDQKLEEVIGSMKIGGRAITPEVRMYLGRGYGQGFYVAPFYRYASFEGSGAQLTFDTYPGQTESIVLSGTTKAHTAGLLLGAQWVLGKHLSLDWWMLGPHAGTGKAQIDGVASKTLDAYEQDVLRDELEQLDLPGKTKEIQVNANSGQLKLGGAMAGVRAGLALGFRF